MSSADYQIAVATRDDIASILALQEENLPENGGLLSVRLPFQWFEAALAQMPIILARKSGHVVGYLVASALSSQAHLPIIQSMMRAYSALPDAYLYGPICVAASERGRGLPTQLFATQQRLLANRPCFTFIRATILSRCERTKRSGCMKQLSLLTTVSRMSSSTM